MEFAHHRSGFFHLSADRPVDARVAAALGNFSERPGGTAGVERARPLWNSHRSHLQLCVLLHPLCCLYGDFRRGPTLYRPGFSSYRYSKGWTGQGGDCWLQSDGDHQWKCRGQCQWHGCFHDSFDEKSWLFGSLRRCRRGGRFYWGAIDATHHGVCCLHHGGNGGDFLPFDRLIRNHSRCGLLCRRFFNGGPEG